MRERDVAGYDFTKTRLFVEAALSEGGALDLERAQANYLLSVLRMGDGSELLVFNGRDGEWRAALESSGRKAGRLRLVARTRPQDPAADLVLMFAPLKHARLDYMIQKAVEMGVGRLQPVITRRTQVSRVNLERMRANVIEAAEQCGILAVPEVSAEQALPVALAALERDRLLVFCDEDCEAANPADALAGEADMRGLALLIGPEGGFADEERRLVSSHPRLRRISLGPRILRADTAAVAALAIVQATLGDWR